MQADKHDNGHDDAAGRMDWRACKQDNGHINMMMGIAPKMDWRACKQDDGQINMKMGMMTQRAAGM
jgi:hypothetical protein